MLFQEHGINFNDLPTRQKRGRCVVKMRYHIENVVEFQAVRTLDSLDTIEMAEVPILETYRSKWVLDEEIPIFSQDRNYIQRLVDLQEETCGTSLSAIPTLNPTT
jgi:hypothetical protein